MASTELENLVRTGHLKREAFLAAEFEGLVHSGEQRLADAAQPSLSFVSRFDLAYNGAHALALAALRRHGYRSDNRYVVFQALPHTAGLPAPTWRVLATAHNVRNRAEYEGVVPADERLLADVLEAAAAILGALKELPSEPRGGAYE